LNLGFNKTGFLVLILFLLLPTAVVLYWCQHTGILPGGAIAPSKLGWLVVAKEAKWILWLFFSSMLLRAIIELSMMYLTNNWLHAYGIAHNMLSIVICLFGALFLFQSSRIIAVFFAYSGILFTLEIYFARYLQAVSHGDGSVFFLESAPEHATVLWLTRIAVLTSIVIFITIITRSTGDTT